MTLYKYLHNKYLEAFFKRGSLKIGTLHEYRDAEAYGPAIGDDAEGVGYTRFSMAKGGVVDMGSNSREAQFLKTLPGFERAGPDLKIEFAEGAEILFKQHLEDVYIFCTSTSFDPAVMKDFGGSCFEITKPQEFLKAVSRVIRHKGDFFHHGPVHYKNREVRWPESHNVHPVLMKDVKYAYQNEARSIWLPKKEAIRPLFVDVPDAVKYCRVIHTSRV